MKTAIIFDVRNLYGPRDIKSQGVEFQGIGRVFDSGEGSSELTFVCGII
jgi:hypothetical protein